MLTSVDVYKKIAPKFGDEEAATIIAFIEDSIQRGTATKADLQETARELETNLRNEIGELRNEMKAIETNLRNEIGELKNEIAELRSLLIKYILPLSALIGSAVGAIISILLR